MQRITIKCGCWKQGARVKRCATHRRRQELLDIGSVDIEMAQRELTQKELMRVYTIRFGSLLRRKLDVEPRDIAAVQRFLRSNRSPRRPQTALEATIVKEVLRLKPNALAMCATEYPPLIKAPVVPYRYRSGEELTALGFNREEIAAIRDGVEPL